MKTDSELLEEMRNKLTIETDGCMQVAAIFNIKERAEELKELHRLADIGRATEKAFDNGLHLHSKVKELHGDTSDIDVILNTYELLEWAK